MKKMLLLLTMIVLLGTLPLDSSGCNRAARRAERQGDHRHGRRRAHGRPRVGTPLLELLALLLQAAAGCEENARVKRSGQSRGGHRNC